ncbi:MAG TPA: hypothetical protein VMU47_09365 [Caldimonas sp.]|nr:hypothetical protein [Caldimonas sp.]
MSPAFPSSLPERPPRVVALLLAAACLVVAQTAPAQKREGAFGKGRPGGPLLKPAELRDCLARQDRIHAATQETTQQQAKLQADRSEIDRLAASLKEQMAVLDRKNADAVSAYNAQVETRDKLIDSYQDAVPAFNAKVEALKAEQAAFARACEGRRYDEDDAAAIRKGG